MTITVLESQFLGERLRITAETEPGHSLIIEAHHQVQVREGDKVPVCIDVANMHFIPTRQSTKD